MDQTEVKSPKSPRSPNVQIRPSTARTNALGHLEIGGCDTVELAERFGTPLLVLDEETIREAIDGCLRGLEHYPQARALYAGKAFMCTAICHLVRKLGVGVDVVSEGELYTATRAGFEPSLVYMHGNNKSRVELSASISHGINIVADNLDELKDIAQESREQGVPARVMLRVTPGVEPDTHSYIRTGQTHSKFGFPIDEVLEAAQYCLKNNAEIEFLGIHAHIGSQGKELEPFLEVVDIMADLAAEIKSKLGNEIAQLDVGGGLGIAYCEEDSPAPIYEWSAGMAKNIRAAFEKRGLKLPLLLLEPGRSIVGTAGVTLYRAGYEKRVPDGTRYLAVDGGMADNPRPITYQAIYTATVANRPVAPDNSEKVTIVGRYCESGDIIIKEAALPAQSGDLIAIFATGAYTYSMASNYNRTPRPACILVSNGIPELIIERETNEDLLRHDRVPPRLQEGT